MTVRERIHGFLKWMAATVAAAWVVCWVVFLIKLNLLDRASRTYWGEKIAPWFVAGAALVLLLIFAACFFSTRQAIIRAIALLGGMMVALYAAPHLFGTVTLREVVTHVLIGAGAAIVLSAAVCWLNRADWAQLAVRASAPLGVLVLPVFWPVALLAIGGCCAVGYGVFRLARFPKVMSD